MDQLQVFEGVTNPFQFKEIITKAQKRYIVSGYISTMDLDLAGDQVTSECLQDMLSQIQNGSVKMDWEHETILEQDLNKVPRARIIPESAKVDGKGLWVEAEINPDHKDFNEIWGSIKNKFLDAFSIAFRPVEAVVKWMGDKAIRILNKIKLINVGITGNPVNEEAKMDAVIVKALTALGSGLLDSGNKDQKESEDNQQKIKTQTEDADSPDQTAKPLEGAKEEPVEKKALTYEGTQVYAGEKSSLEVVAEKFSKTYDIKRELIIEGIKEELVHLGTVNNDMETIAEMASTRIREDPEFYQRQKAISNRESYSSSEEGEVKTEVTKLDLPEEKGTKTMENIKQVSDEDEKKQNKEDYKSEIATIKSDIESLKSEIQSLKGMYDKEKKMGDHTEGKDHMQGYKQYESTDKPEDEEKQYPEKKSVLADIKSIQEDIEALKSQPVLKSLHSEVPTEINEKELPSVISLIQ